MGPLSGWVRKTLEPELFRAGYGLRARHRALSGICRAHSRHWNYRGGGHAALLHRLCPAAEPAGMLVEMHMLKDYRTRVTGNYELLRALLEVVNRDATKLVEANQRADRETVARGRAHNQKLALQLRGNRARANHSRFKAYRWKIEHSEISGDGWVQYSHEPVTITRAPADHD